MGDWHNGNWHYGKTHLLNAIIFLYNNYFECVGITIS